MARRNDHTKDELKLLVIESATKIIEEEGLESLSTRKIATDIGYAAGTLYNIFKNTDDIILHINSRTMSEITEVFNAPEKIYVLNDLLNIIIHYLNYIEENTALWSCLFIYKTSNKNLPDWYIEKLELIINDIANSLPPENSNNQDEAELIWNAVNGICFVGSTSLSIGGGFYKTKEKCLRFALKYLRKPL